MANSEELNKIIANKDLQIVALSGQNTQLQERVVELQNQIGLLQDQIEKLNTNVAKLADSIASNKNITRSSKRKNAENGTENLTKYFKPVKNPENAVITDVSDDEIANSINESILNNAPTADNDEDMPNDNLNAFFAINNCNNFSTGGKITSIADQTVNTSFAQVVKNSSKSKSMPIQLASVSRDDVNGVIQLLHAEIAAEDFECIQLKRDSPMKIFPKNVQVKGRIIKLLADKGLEFNTFAEKNEKRSSFIVRGLNYGSDNQNISFINRALLEVGLKGPVEISRFYSGYMKRNYDSDQTALYRIIVGNSDNIAALTGIKVINGFRVVIEKMRKSAVIQCRRCQRFQHTASSCSFKYRCVQCVTVHGPGDCPRLTNKKLPLQCCNCTAAGFKKSNHTANNLNSCEFFKSGHSRLFEKFQKTVAANAIKFDKKKTNTVAARAADAELLAGPAPANNPWLSKSSKNKNTSKNSKNKSTSKNSTGLATATNAGVGTKSTNGSSIVDSNTNVHSGGSHTSSAMSDEKLHALAGALVQVLRQYL